MGAAVACDALRIVCSADVCARLSTKRDGVPTGIRTRVSALKGPRPRPLDDGDSMEHWRLAITNHQSRTNHKSKITNHTAMIAERRDDRRIWAPRGSNPGHRD